MRPARLAPVSAITTSLVACALAFLVTACGAGQPSAASPPAIGAPMPAGVSVLRSAPLSSGTVGTAQNCHPLASLRPSGPLAPAGHMPAGSTMARIAKRGYLIAGVDQTTYLDGYRNPLTGQLQGFDIEVARRIAHAIFGNHGRIQLRAISQARRI